MLFLLILSINLTNLIIIYILKMEIETKNFSVKWNKQVFQINTSKNTIADLKQELQGITNVLADRQKLTLKGKMLKNEDNISVIPDKSQITLIGTAENDIITTTKNNNIVFMEDLTKEDKIKILKEKGEDILNGLQNLGNTCYFNSLIQCLGRVEPLKAGLIEISKNKNVQNSGLNTMFCAEMGRTYESLDKATDAVAPYNLVQQLRILNPAFGDTSGGGYKQQDADECLILMLNIFKELKNPATTDKYSDCLIDELFNITMDITMTNIEDNTEIKTSKDNAYKLVCYIDKDTTELVMGLKNSLAENLDLFSDKLGRNTVFIKKQLISRLPPYLNIQLMRFFWKKAVEDMQGSKDDKAKILKSVMFSKTIDIFDFCTPEVQEILKLGRDIETKMLKDDPQYRSDLSCVKQSDNMIPTGRYQLIACVTHQGRSSESGHYIGWTHRKNDNWAKFDDDYVTNVKTQDILELKGGGDWHMAYILIYKSLEVPFQEI